MPSSRGELAAIHPKFAEDSPARCRDKKEGESIMGLTDYVYSAEDNKAIEDWMRQNVRLWPEAGSINVTYADSKYQGRHDVAQYGHLPDEGEGCWRSRRRPTQRLRHQGPQAGG